MDDVWLLHIQKSSETADTAWIPYPADKTRDPPAKTAKLRRRTTELDHLAPPGMEQRRVVAHHGLLAGELPVIVMDNADFH